MGKAPRKLTLSRETLASMQNHELDGVNGGTTPATPAPLVTPWCPVIGGAISAISAISAMSLNSYLYQCPTMKRSPESPKPSPPNTRQLSSEPLDGPHKKR